MAALQLRVSTALLHRSSFPLEAHHRPAIAGRGVAFIAGRIGSRKYQSECCSHGLALCKHHRSFVQIQCQSKHYPIHNSQLPVSMCLIRNDTSAQEFEVNTTLNYTEDQQETGEPVKLYPASEQVDGKHGTEMLDNKEDLSQQRKGAKIHDFCLGIPFGGIVFGGGLFGFLFWKTPATSMISGAAILAMGFISLKVWRQGKSSLPLILGQAAIAATLFWKHFQLYPVTKKLFPSGFYVFVSGAMLCFYSYVLIAGGNPPPKKKLAASPSS